MSEKPLPDLTQTKNKWSVGTLTYTAAGLAVLFALLLWGDFAWSMKDRVVFPMTVKLAKERFELNDTLYSILIISFPNFTNIFLMPIVSYLSDRHRGPRSPHPVPAVHHAVHRDRPARHRHERGDRRLD